MHKLTQQELENRRDAILTVLGLTHTEYVLKSMHDGLSPFELEYYSELELIDFLLTEGTDE